MDRWSKRCGLRGIDTISAATFIASTGHLSRFELQRLSMGYLGLVPCEHSGAGTIRRGDITKTGNREARQTLIEAAWIELAAFGKSRAFVSPTWANLNVIARERLTCAPGSAHTDVWFRVEGEAG